LGEEQQNVREWMRKVPAAEFLREEDCAQGDYPRKRRSVKDGGDQCEGNVKSEGIVYEKVSNANG